MGNYIVISLNDFYENLNKDKVLLNEVFRKFSCRREKDLENFLHCKALDYELSDFGKTFLFFDKDKFLSEDYDVLAFFTIGYTSIDISSISKKKKRKMLGNYPGRDRLNNIPAFLIGQLGKNDNHINYMSGEVILNEAYSTIKKANVIIGGKLLVLECRGKMFEKFYKKFEFTKLYEESDKDGLLTLYKKLNFKND
ncbi:hypothetical protein HZY83_07290 [Gemella sp. GH3]|uniref:hypothetical protein n=1 Tax=unclassified Gemella TaxID=2624949 RepID=UPI0015CFB8DE|nr:MULTISPECIES: hypothetical protein [unclassified Gemella]MBF0714477.1 hypothetical protein [Gemella sp. GH3.1]NYS51429.1 hypothetical protein [Gemella sp. GH3]